MTGIDDPYETPRNPELQLDGGALSVVQTVDAAISFLRKRGLLNDERSA